VIEVERYGKAKIASPPHNLARAFPAGWAEGETDPGEMHPFGAPNVIPIEILFS
jgi:hypothetical protein